MLVSQMCVAHTEEDQDAPVGYNGMDVEAA